MLTESALRFHVIFVPGTVGPLTPCLNTLLRWTRSCRFRLVANGCDAAEVRELERLCGRHERLEHVSLSRDLLRHGDALSRLARASSDSLFAFLDSDIFATGWFVPQTLEALEHSTAVFSCSVPWLGRHSVTMPAGFRHLAGAYQRLHDDTCVGNSFFGVYVRERLMAVMDASGADFRAYRWRGVPRSLRPALASAGLARAAYDTGKLLNVVLGLHGERLALVPLPALWHLGGVSARAARYGVESALRSRLQARLPLWIRQAYYSASLRSAIGREETHTLATWSAARRRTSAFFWAVLHGDEDGAKALMERGGSEAEDVRKIASRLRRELSAPS